MKLKTLLLFLLSGIAFGAFAQQTPQAFKYQAVARDTAGKELRNRTINFRVSVLKGSTVGTSVYTETHTITTNNFGVANITVGDGSVVSGTFATVDWGSAAHFLKIEMDVNAGTNYQVMGASQLLSVPYALYSGKSGSGGSSQLLKQGNGIILRNDSIINVLPDRTVTLTQGTGINISGIYPNFTIANSQPDKTLSLTGSNGVTITGTYPNLNIAGAGSTGPDSGWYYKNKQISFTNGNVGIGTKTPTRPLQFRNLPLSDTRQTILDLRVGPGSSSGGTNAYTGIYSMITGDGANGFNTAIYGFTTSATPGTGTYYINQGVQGYADSSTQVNRGLSGGAFGTNSIQNQGIFGRSYDSNTGDNVGMYSIAANAAGINYGAYCAADGSTGSNYGIYASGTSYAGYFNGDVNVTGNVYQASDANLKENIDTISNALGLITRLQPLSYNFVQNSKMGLPESIQYGFLAQDVKKVIPTIVKTQTALTVSDSANVDFTKMNTTSYESINYIQMIPLLTKSIIELNAIIEAQNKRILELEKSAGIRRE
ncbi:MAG: tail fiber domain-containing protein [Bacteroidota bacterium]